MPVTYAGHNGSGADSTVDTELSFTTVRTIAAGETVVLCGGINGGSLSDIASVSVGSLSLGKVVEGVLGSTAQTEIWSAKATSELASGSTVTVTWGSSNGNKTGICLSLSGSAAAAESSAGGSSSSDNTPTTSAIASSDLSVTVAVISTNTGTITAGTGYTEISQQTVNSTYDLQAQYNEAPATSEDSDWTISSFYNSAWAIASFGEDWPASGEEDAPEVVRVVASGMRF